MKMTVVYDITVLGWSVHDERSRTGIARVIENVASGISRLPDFKLRCGSSRSNGEFCLEYLKGHKLLERYMSDFIYDLNDVRSYFRGKRSLWAMLSAGLSCSLPIIYHSPFYPIPEHVRRESHIRKVQTVYDLIPLTNPELFAEGDKHAIVDVLESFSPDMHFICISESTKRDLCSFAPQIDPEHVHVTHLAASDLFYPCKDLVHQMQTRHRYGIPDGMGYMLSVCTLEPRKNIELAIRSFVMLLKEQGIKDLCLVLTGTRGWSYDRIFSEIDNAPEFMDKIILTGFVPDEDLAPLYSGALAFVYPSLYEGFGLPPLEAMQCGTPVITSNTSSLPEVVGDAGIMVDPRDGDGLCQAMLDMYRDESLRMELSERSLARAASFSWEKCVAETIAVYHRATGS